MSSTKENTQRTDLHLNILKNTSEGKEEKCYIKKKNKKMIT